MGQTWKVCDTRYTLLIIRFWGNFGNKELQILICPNFSWNTRIQYLLGTFNIWIKLPDTGVNLWDEKVVSSKFHK